MITIQLNEKYVIKSPITGNPDFDQVAFDYRSNLLVWGCPTKKVGNTVKMNLINGVTLDTMDFLFLMSKDNGAVEGWLPWLSVQEANYEDEIPVGLPRRTYTLVLDDRDPENLVTVEKVHTWKTWKQENYTVDLIDGKYYYMAHAGNIKGAPLKDTELLLIYGSTGVELMNTKPIIEVQDGN